jgi:hypothetical protein
MADTTWVAKGQRTENELCRPSLGAVPQLHAVVIGGIKGDDSSSACSALTLTIYDPWPVGVGDIYLVDYERLMTKFPMATMYMLQR